VEPESTLDMQEVKDLIASQLEVELSLLDASKKKNLASHSGIRTIGG